MIFQEEEARLEAERLRAEEEEQRRLEEETIRLANEAREAEEQRLLLAIEEAKRREEEDRRKREEEVRQKQEKEEAERKAREEAERLVSSFAAFFRNLVINETNKCLFYIEILDNESRWPRGLRRRKRSATPGASESRRLCLERGAKINPTRLPR